MLQSGVSTSTTAVTAVKQNFLNTRNILTFFACLLVLVLLFFGLCSIFVVAYNAALSSDFFLTRHVDVTGNARLSKDKVMEYAGIKKGENCLSVSIARVEQNLRATAWVEEVSVKRLLPDKFVIRLKERLPSFWIQKNGTLFYTNEVGEIIAPVESSNFLSLPTLFVDSGGEDNFRYLPLLLKSIQSGLLPIELYSVTSVTLSERKGVVLYVEDREMRVAIATDNWDGNLAHLGMALGDLARRNELKNLREISAANGNVWVLFK